VVLDDDGAVIKMSGYVCNICNRKFTTNTGLSNHKRFHNPDWVNVFCKGDQSHMLKYIPYKEEIINKYNSGISGSIITKEYNIKRSTLYNYLKKWGVNLRSGKFKQNHTTNLGKTLPRFTKEHCKKISEAKKGFKHTEETKRKMSLQRSGDKNAMFGKHWSKEEKTNMSIIQKEKWKDKKWVIQRIKKYKKSPNKTELVLSKFLKPYGFKFVGDGKFWIGYPPKNPDFINKKEKKIIEFFGRYFHKEEDEKIRYEQFKKYGWETKVLWSDDINFNPTRHIKLTKNDEKRIIERCIL